MKNILILVITLTVFTGCLTKEVPSYSTYSLKLNHSTIHKSIKTNKSILIVQPKSLNSLKTKNIIYSNNLEQNFYALSVWSDEPSKMIQQLLTSYLSKQNSYTYVTSSKLKQRNDFILYSDLIQFEHKIENKISYANVHIRVYLQDNRTNKIFSKEFMYKKEVENMNAHSAVDKLNEIVNQFVGDVNEFILKKVSS